MLKRIITSLVAICVLVPALIFSDTWFFSVAIAFFSCGALFEIFKCLGKGKKFSLTVPAYIFSASAPFLIRIFSEDFAKIAVVCAIAYLVYLFGCCVASKGKFPFGEMSELYLLVLYIIGAFNCIIFLRDSEKGQYIYLLIFLGAWITDIFAYFCGMLFGKHKLIPEVSPKKTIEGSIGGALFCALSFVIFGVIISTIDINITVNYVFLGIGGLIVSVVAQVGDLIMSVIKREHNIKDFGKLFPGHGGVLDRFDSIFAVTLMITAIVVFSDVIGLTFINGGI